MVYVHCNGWFIGGFDTFFRRGFKDEDFLFTVAVLDVLEEQRSAGIANAARTGNNLK